MHIQIDSREKTRAIRKIVTEFGRSNVKHFVSKLLVGDYMSFDNPRLIIDRKQNLTELCSNVCQQHERFRDELLRARDNDIKLIILVEHGQGIESLEDIIWWDNPRSKVSAKAVQGDKLYNILLTMQRKYGCEYSFCNKNDTGKEIIRILGGEINDKGRDQSNILNA